MNGGIMISFVGVFQTHFSLTRSMLWREEKMIHMMLEAPDCGSPSSLSRLPQRISQSLSVASGIAQERVPCPLLALAGKRSNISARARKTTIRSPLHHPSGTFWRVTTVHSRSTSPTSQANKTISEITLPCGGM